MRRASLLLLLCLSPAMHGQWQLQNAHTTADLRGIDNVGNGIAWASGNHGTVLRTLDGGTTWQRCATPPDAEALDFRGVQAFDKDTAIVMSSGKGDLSRLYRTYDGCKTWKLVFSDPESTGFFDSLHRVTAKQLFLLGDPVDGKFAMFSSRDGGATWFIEADPGLEAPHGASAFAASNSALTSFGPYVAFATGGSSASVYVLNSTCNAQTGQCTTAWKASETPLTHGTTTSGAFSLAGRFAANAAGKIAAHLIVVGGTYDKPGEGGGNAAYSLDDGATWTLSATLPGGYRSTVSYDKAAQSWITVGPNGTDISTDDGKNWSVLKPSPHDDPEADQHWNALSLPFAVGPKGRIGFLRQSDLKPPR